MGTIKKKTMPKKWDLGKLTDQQAYHLIVGHSPFDPFPFENEEHRKALWFRFRGELIKRNWENLNLSSDPDKGGLFSRPWGFWAYEAKEPRRLLMGKFPEELLKHGLSFGRPRCWHHGYSSGCTWETQEQYLTRLNLLLPEEKEALRTGKVSIDEGE